MIEGLNVAYEVTEDRAFWKTRFLAVALTFVSGTLMLIAAGIMVAGPKFGTWLAGQVQIPPPFPLFWLFIHRTIAFAFGILAAATLYFLAPNIRQNFRSTLPGAILAVCFWIGLSCALGIYFRHFGTYNKTYGTLGAGIVLMIWLYWTGFAMLAGAEFNTVLKQLGEKRQLQLNDRKVPRLARVV